MSETTESRLRCMVEGTADGPLVRRKLVVFRRLEPGDVRTEGTHTLPHSPYLEAKVIDVALSKSLHDDMVRVEAKRKKTLTGDRSLLHTFDVPGMILGLAGGGLAGSYLGYMPQHLRPYLLGLFALGVVVGLITRVLRKRADEDALRRWNEMPEQKEHARIARELTEAWTRFSAQVKREHDFHTLLRVGEGSTEPQRLCSIDPRGFEASPPFFDPEDWLPTEGGGVRYEEVDVMGELVTRGLDGVDDVAAEPAEAAPAHAESKAADASGQEDSEEDSAGEEGEADSGEDDSGEQQEDEADSKDEEGGEPKSA